MFCADPAGQILMELEAAAAAAAFLRERPPVLNSLMTEVWKTQMLLVLPTNTLKAQRHLGVVVA